MLFFSMVALAAAFPSSAEGAEQVGASLKQKLPWYHTTGEVHKSLQDLAATCRGASVEMQSRLLVNTIGSVREEYPFDILRVRSTTVVPKMKAIFVFGEHARELVSVESALDLIRTFCGEGPSADRAASILDSVEVIVVPNANPIGRTQVEGGSFCKRTNENGVDLNRNWGDEHRDEKFIEITHGEETYPGPKGFSEPETQILKSLVDQERPDIYLSVHSGAHLLGIPYGYSGRAKVRNERDDLDILHPISQRHCNGTCPYGNLAQLVGYDNEGCDIDYLSGQVGTPYAFTWEIYAGGASEPEAPSLATRGKSPSDGSQSFLSLAQEHTLTAQHQQHMRNHQRVNARLPESQQDPQECISHFNPLTEAGTRSVLDNWTGAYLYLCELVTQHSAQQEAKESKLGAIALVSFLSGH